MRKIGKAIAILPLILIVTMLCVSCSLGSPTATPTPTPTPTPTEAAEEIDWSKIEILSVEEVLEEMWVVYQGYYDGRLHPPRVVFIALEEYGVEAVKAAIIADIQELRERERLREELEEMIHKGVSGGYQ